MLHIYYALALCEWSKLNLIPQLNYIKMLMILYCHNNFQDFCCSVLGQLSSNKVDTKHSVFN